MAKVYGEIVPGLELYGSMATYPVVNERVVRAMAGIMLVVATAGLVHDNLVVHHFDWLKYVTIFFFIDFAMRVALGPMKSPLAAIASFIMRRHEPEWSGAIQKRFAWSIGFALSGTMVYVTNTYANAIQAPIAIYICAMCIAFMWMETAFSFCLGCKMYDMAMKTGFSKTPDVKPACPGGVCSLRPVGDTTPQEILFTDDDDYVEKTSEGVNKTQSE